MVLMILSADQAVRIVELEPMSVWKKRSPVISTLIPWSLQSTSRYYKRKDDEPQTLKDLQPYQKHSSPSDKKNYYFIKSGVPAGYPSPRKKIMKGP